MIADGFRQRAVANLPVEHLLELRVAARDGVSDHDEIQLGGDVLGPIALEKGDALLHEEIAHRRVDVLVGTADVVTLALQQRGERRHRGAAHADQVNASHETAASSITSRG